MNVELKQGESNIVASIRRNRSRIVGMSLNRSVQPGRHTIFADALCNRTLDYLIKAIEDGDDEPMYAWITKSLRGFTREQSLFEMFPSTVSATLDVLIHNATGSDSVVYSWLERVQQRVGVMVSASRLEFHEERFSLDSIDAKIDEVLYHLSERDTTTAEHSRSVGLWCWRIAKRMGLTRDETLFATRSGLIHDIGKMNTPLEILTAPRSLDAREWAIMRQHTLEGVKTLENIPELRYFIPAVRWHHERIDGRGYPDGLEGSAIPLNARIVAVADAFNAMVARRPYREPLSPTVAVEELKKHSGAHFDPSIVVAMIDVVAK